MDKFSCFNLNGGLREGNLIFVIDEKGKNVDLDQCESMNLFKSIKGRILMAFNGNSVSLRDVS